MFGAGCGLRESRPKTPAEKGEASGGTTELLGVLAPNPAPKPDELCAGSNCLKICIRSAAPASGTAGLLLVSLLPLVNVFNLGGEAAWHLWLPALGQNMLMTRVLKGEALDRIWE